MKFIMCGVKIVVNIFHVFRLVVFFCINQHTMYKGVQQRSSFLIKLKLLIIPPCASIDECV